MRSKLLAVLISESDAPLGLASSTMAEKVRRAQKQFAARDPSFQPKEPHQGDIDRAARAVSTAEKLHKISGAFPASPQALKVSVKSKEAAESARRAMLKSSSDEERAKAREIFKKATAVRGHWTQRLIKDAHQLNAMSGRQPAYVTRPHDSKLWHDPRHYRVTPIKPKPESGRHVVYMVSSMELSRKPLLVEAFGGTSFDPVERWQSPTSRVVKMSSSESQRLAAARKAAESHKSIVDKQKQDIVRREEIQKKWKEKLKYDLGSGFERPGFTRPGATTKDMPSRKPSSENVLGSGSSSSSRTLKVISEIVTTIAVGPSPHIRPDLIGKTIAGGEPINGVTSTANIGLRSSPTGFAVFAHRALAAKRTKRKKK